MSETEKIEFAADEDETDTDSDSDSNKSSKRSVNLLEEEMHLAEGISSDDLHLFLDLSKSKGYFSVTKFPIGKERKPLENPPEMITLFS